jgi:hypothetical protein
LTALTAPCSRPRPLAMLVSVNWRLSGAGLARSADSGRAATEGFAGVRIGTCGILGQGPGGRNFGNWLQKI